MNNPYAPPTAVDEPAPPANRKLLLLAAIGAWAAALYWAALTALIALAATTGRVSGFQAILPLVLIALYSVRGFQLLKGDRAAVVRLLWLHVVGGVIAVTQMMQARDLLMVLQGVKIGVHVFGGVTTWLVHRSLKRP